MVNSQIQFQILIKPNFRCYYCDHTAAQLQFETTDFFGDQYQLVKCAECGTINLHPRPTTEQLERAYDRDYYGSGDQKFNPVIERMLLLSKIRRARAIARLVKSGKVLDIGCADGSFLSQFKRFGDFELEGIELDKHAAVRAAKNPDINLHIGRLRDFDLEAGTYAAITLNHVFEHLDDPRFTLEKATELLRPGGVLLLAIPNIGSNQARWFKENWFHLDPPRHLFFMTRDQLNSELGKLGFKLADERHNHLEYNPYGFQQSIFNRYSKQREALYEYLKGNHHLVKESKARLRLQRFLTLGSLPFFYVSDRVAARRKRAATMELLYQKQD